MYRIFFRIFLSRLPAEGVHHAALAALRAFMWLFGFWLRPRAVRATPELAVDALGLRFPNPIGLAAGFDKNATAYEDLSALGFGFVEVGTVTAEPQPGNPKPRLFRLAKDRALVNRMGFNNLGARAVAEHLTAPRRVPLGVNIGKTKVVPEADAPADYAASARLLGPLADYVVVNVSSPNTPGLRNLQAIEQLRPLLAAVQAELARAPAPKPLLVKIAPDLSDEDIDAIADLAIELGLDGIIATNTTISRAGLVSSREEVEGCGAGGLSGAVLKQRSLAVLARLHRRIRVAVHPDEVRERAPSAARAPSSEVTAPKPKPILVSVGGIETAEDVWERLCAGASLVQLYTGFVYGGPLVVWSLRRALTRRMRASGVPSVAALVGREFC